MNPAIRKIAAWAHECGWRVEDTTRGYTMFFTPSGDFAGRYPATPSNPYRRMKKLESRLQANGLKLPPPSKKQLRALRGELHGEEANQDD